MKHEKELNNFLENCININATRLDNARNKTNSTNWTLVSFLKNQLGSSICYTSYQWSFAYKTIIKPNQNDEKWQYDVDVAVKMKYNPDWEWNEKNYHQVIINVLENSDRYKDKLDKTKERAIRINYDESDGEFYVDLVPMFQKNDKWYVINRKNNIIEVSWWSLFRDWVNEQNNKSNGYLKKVIRIFKFLKNQVNPDLIRSVQLTLLLWKQIDKFDIDAFDNLTNALLIIANWLKEDLMSISDIKYLDLSNPKLSEEKFDRNFDNENFLEFKDWFIDIVDEIHDACSEDDKEISIEKWKEIFWDNFQVKVNKFLTLYPHAENPESFYKKSLDVKKIDIIAEFIYKHNRVKNLIYNWKKIPQNVILNFFAKLPKDTNPNNIVWQVTNEPNIYVKNIRWELWNNNTNLWYINRKGFWIEEDWVWKGRHWVKCYLIDNETIIWESDRFYIVI